MIVGWPFHSPAVSQRGRLSRRIFCCLCRRAFTAQPVQELPHPGRPPIVTVLRPLQHTSVRPNGSGSTRIFPLHRDSRCGAKQAGSTWEKEGGPMKAYRQENLYRAMASRPSIASGPSRSETRNPYIHVFLTGTGFTKSRKRGFRISRLFHRRKAPPFLSPRVRPEPSPDHERL